MNAAVGQKDLDVSGYQTLDAISEDQGFKVRETDGHFRHTSRTEAVIRFVGIVIILGAFVQHIAPDANFAGNPAVTKILLSVAFSCIGLACYSFAVRGHRSEVLFDPARQDLCISNLDRRNNVRTSKRIPLRRVKSLYVLKSETPGVPSKLRVKLIDSPNEVTAIRGKYEDIEMMHRQLCRSIRMTQV